MLRDDSESRGDTDNIASCVAIPSPGTLSGSHIILGVNCFQESSYSRSQIIQGVKLSPINYTIGVTFLQNSQTLVSDYS